jgi:hypothetical protein
MSLPIPDVARSRASMKRGARKHDAKSRPDRLGHIAVSL